MADREAEADLAAAQLLSAARAPRADPVGLARQVARALEHLRPGELERALLAEAGPGEADQALAAGLRQAVAERALTVARLAAALHLAAELDPLAGLRRRAVPSRGLAQWAVAELPSREG